MRLGWNGVQCEIKELKLKSHEIHIIDFKMPENNEIKFRMKYII